MKALRQWLRLTYFLLVCITICLPFESVSANAPDRLLLVEFQTRGTAASEEFVEIYNDSLSPVSLKGMRLQYKSASGTSWSTKYTFGDIYIAARSRLLLTSNGYLTTVTSLHFASGFSDDGGHIRLIDENTDSPAVFDFLAWGTAVDPEVTAAVPLLAGSSLRRLIDEDGNFIDTDDNSADFEIDSTPSPTHEALYIPVEAEEPEPVPEPEKPNEIPPTPEEPLPDDTELPPIDLLPVIISELLPNPASPQTDAEDEFIELFNPNDVAVDISGYQLRMGTTFSTLYTFPSQSMIEPLGYMIVSSGETTISLTNTSGIVRLMDGQGVVVDETENYTDAPAGQAWARKPDNTWTWTTTSTQLMQNLFTLPVAPEPKAVTPKPVAPKKTAPKTSKAPKTQTAKVASAKSSKKTAPKTLAATDNKGNEFAEEPIIRSINRNVLAGVGGLALLYAGYEYRKDIQNRLYRARRNRQDRGASGQ